MIGAVSTSRMTETRKSNVRLVAVSTRDFRKPSEKMSQLGRRFSTAIFPVYSSYTDARWSNTTPSSFMSRRRSIGSLPRASARLTTTRSTWCSRTILGMSSTVPMTSGLVSCGPTVSTNPTISAPSSWYRDRSSAARPTAAGPVPTTSRRSAGPTRPTVHSNANRQPATSVTTANAAMRNTPRPITSDGNQ